MQALGRGWLIGALACIAGIDLAGCPASSAGGKIVKKDAGGYDAGSLDAAVYCPPGVMTSESFTINAESSGKQITARLADAKPSPPARYNNVWTIELVDASGNAIEDANITKAYAYMPFHGHSKPAYSIMKTSEPGRFEVGLNFFMPGDFEVQLTLASQSAGNDYLTFEYCVE